MGLLYALGDLFQSPEERASGSINALQRFGRDLGDGSENRTPSALLEWKAFSAMPEDQQAQYLQMKRALPLLNQGDQFSSYNPVTKQTTPVAPINPKVSETPQFKADVVGAEEDAKTQQERQKNLSKAQGGLTGFEQQSKLVMDNIDKALELAKNPLATGYGQFSSALPDTPARALNNYLDTIKSNITFDKLQQMRESSPTGGALGQVSDFENKLLAATQGTLDPKQADQLKENLTKIKELYPRVLENRQKAFQQDYGKFLPAALPAASGPAPAPAEDLSALAPGNNTPGAGVSLGGGINGSAPGIRDGATATNPKTGAKIIFKSGKWQAVK